MYLGAQAVVLDGSAHLQAIQYHLARIVKVGAVAAEIHVKHQFETIVDIGVPKSALHKETFLISLGSLRLGERAMTAHRDYAVGVAL